MYTIYVVNNGTRYLLHAPTSNDYKVVSPQLVLELNKTGTLTFQITHDHPHFNQIKKMESEIVVYDDSEVLWTGRPIECEISFYNVQTITCEGILGYLLDSQMPPFVNQAGIRSFLTTLLNNHNNRVGLSSNKVIQVGNITVTDDNDYIYRASENYASTLDLINEKLVNTLGGYISIRETSGIRYLDYLASAQMNEQTVSFGENLIDMSRFIKADTLCTAVIPRGAEYEVTSGSGEEEETETKILDITDYPETMYHPANADYVYDSEAVSTYGYIYKVVEFPNVTIQQNLYNKALDYLRSAYVLTNTIELSAVDLSLLDTTLESFRLGDAVRVNSSPHNVSGSYLVNAITYDLANPVNSMLSLGGVSTTYTRSIEDKLKDHKIDIKESEDRTRQLKDEVATNKEQIKAKIENDIKSATDKLSGETGGYVYLDRDSEGKPFRLVALNTNSIDTATSMIILNENGLGFSTRLSPQVAWGNYKNAWTIDGQLVAEFVTAAELVTGKISGWEIGPTMFSNGTPGTEGYIAFSSLNGIQLGVNAFVYDKQNGELTINANKVDIEALNTTDPVLTVHGTEIIPDEDDERYTLTLDCTTDFNNSGYEINYSHLEKFNTTLNREVNAKTVMDGEYFSIDSSEADYQHEFGKSSNLLLSTDGLQFGTTFYGDARQSEFSSQQECMIAFSGLSFANYPDDTKNYDARISLNSAGNIVLSGTGWDGSTASSPVIVAQGCYKYTQSGSTLTINSSGTIKRSSSSRKLKENIKSELKTDVKALYDIKVVQFKYKEGVLEETDEWYDKNVIGFIAEQVNEVFPEGVIHSGENFEKCDDWNPRTIIPAMLKLIQEQHEEIESLKQRVSELEENNG